MKKYKKALINVPYRSTANMCLLSAYKCLKNLTINVL